MFKKKIDPKNMKKTPSKVAHNRPPTFFLCTGLAAQTAQKQKSRTTKSPLMQDWVFRLGVSTYFVRRLDCDVGLRRWWVANPIILSIDLSKHLSINCDHYDLFNPPCHLVFCDLLAFVHDSIWVSHRQHCIGRTSAHSSLKLSLTKNNLILLPPYVVLCMICKLTPRPTSIYERWIWFKGEGNFVSFFLCACFSLSTSGAVI